MVFDSTQFGDCPLGNKCIVVRKIDPEKYIFQQKKVLKNKCLAHLILKIFLKDVCTNPDQHDQLNLIKFI